MSQKDSTTIRGPLLLLAGPAAVSLCLARQQKLLQRVGQTVRTLRKARCLTVAKLSQISGVPARSISAIENGGDYGIAVYCLLEKCLGCAPGFLVRAAAAHN